MLYDQRFYDGMRAPTHRLSINFTQRTKLSASTNVFFCDIIRRNLFWTVQSHVKFLRKSLLNITAVLINLQIFWKIKNKFIICALILILSGHAGIF